MTDLPKREEKRVREYVELEVGDKRDPVVLVQKVGSERVLGETHAMYDVQCKEIRWWVIGTRRTTHGNAQRPRTWHDARSALVDLRVYRARNTTTSQ